MSTELPKVQHYVPRMLLKNFAFGKKRKVWVYDKQQDAEYETNIKNIAAEKGFYNISNSDGLFSMEPDLQRLESHCSRVVKSLVASESLRGLEEKDRAVLAVLVAVQKLRTAHIRQSLLKADQLLQERLREMGANLDEIENYEPLDEEGARLVSLKLISEAKEFVPHILEKDWVLLRGNSANPFYISDNPVALQNMRDFGPRGNLGIGVPGIEIYLPLSSTLTLAIYCSSNTELLKQAYSDAKRGGVGAAEVRAHLEEMICAVDTGAPATCREENIVNLNYLQVRYAERQVYCEKRSFALAKDMVDKDPSYKVGPRMTVG